MSHALNIAFFDALAKSGHPFEELRMTASTTFVNQVENSRRVAKEDPEMYYEIQHLNPITERRWTCCWRRWRRSGRQPMMERVMSSCISWKRERNTLEASE